MSPLLKKEIRLLLPGFLAGIVLAFSNCLLPDFGGSSRFGGVLVVFPFLGCPAVAIMMALNCFGAEFSLGTFSNLMAQPVARPRIWSVKILPLAGALIIVGSLWCLFFYLRYAPFRDPQNPQDFGDVVVFAGMFLLVVFSGGLWTVLLLRQVAAAFWFTLLVPVMIFVLASGLTAGLSNEVAEIIIVITLGIYTLAGFGFARWLFLRAQDAQWTGGAIALPEMGRFSRWFAKSEAAETGRRWRPRVALWRKELQLHQSQLIIAGALALLHLGVIATRKLGHFHKNSATEFILESFWWLWLVMPLLVGCAAMAEERKMATLESQLCLPVRRRAQFRIKFLVVLILAIALGTAMPSLLEGNRHFLAGRLPLFLAAISAGVAMIAFYGSSLARNTLQGLAPSVLGLLLVWFIGFVAGRPYDFSLGFLWGGALFYLIAIPVMIAVVTVLAYGNGQRMRITGKVWLKNLLTLVIALALVTATTSAIYHRVWELLSAAEPAHGPLRWTITHPPRMQINSQTITVYLPDGRVWMNRFEPEPTLLGIKIIQDPSFGGGKFLKGTNWTEVRDCWRDIVGVQRDGSLWVSKKPDQIYQAYSHGKLVSEVTDLERFGEGRDWKSVSGRYLMPYLLKTDGTLWIWGTNRWKGIHNWPGLRAFQPQRLGTDSDWAKVVGDNARTYLFKTNGQVWVEPPFATSDETKTLKPGLISIGRARWLENREWTAVGACSCGFTPIWVSVFADGTFREVGSYEWLPTPKHPSEISGPHPAYHGEFAFVEKDIEIGQETNWLGLASENQCAVTLKADGTLWRWDFPTQRWYPRLHVRGVTSEIWPVNFSSHSDWVAVGQMMWGMVTLAADGGLYYWQFQPEMDRLNYYYSGRNSSWLQVSRRPIFLGNIFSQSN